MSLTDYFASIAAELGRKGEQLRLDYQSHRPSGGRNREEFVADFFRSHLPSAFGVSRGLVVSCQGEFARQADVLIVDHQRNAPMYREAPEPIWFIESIYCMLEVKSKLTPSELGDSIQKCCHFKRLPRSFSDLPGLPKIRDSLFVLWAFGGPSTPRVKENVSNAYADIPRSEQPDFIVIPDAVLVRSGKYHELTKLGQEGSPHREQVVAQSRGDLELAIGEPFEVLELAGNTLLVFFVWLLSWLQGAGPRAGSPLSYLPDRFIYGRKL